MGNHGPYSDSAGSGPRALRADGPADRWQRAVSALAPKYPLLSWTCLTYTKTERIQAKIRNTCVLSVFLCNLSEKVPEPGKPGDGSACGPRRRGRDVPRGRAPNAGGRFGEPLERGPEFEYISTPEGLPASNGKPVDSPETPRPRCRPEVVRQEMTRVGSRLTASFVIHRAWYSHN